MKMISPWAALLALFAFTAMPAFAAPAFTSDILVEEEAEGEAERVVFEEEEEEECDGSSERVIFDCGGDDCDGDDEGEESRFVEEEEDGSKSPISHCGECGDDDDHDDDDDDDDDE